MSTVQKFCHSCGRVISRSKSTDANFTAQKYCSHTCKTQKLNDLDRALERTFLSLLKSPHDRRTGVPCHIVQERVFEQSSSTGMALALERERARRAGRRIVVFQDLDTVREHGPPIKLECVQNGKVVEGSFAKGDWGVRVAH